MREIKVNRDELLAAVEKNRKKHITDYAQALEDYKTTCLTKLGEQRTELEARMTELGDVLDFNQLPDALRTSGLSLQKPTSHEKDYDQVILMLKMSVDTVLTIRSDEFACYVMDDWDWKIDFKNQTEFYAINATAAGRMR